MSSFSANSQLVPKLVGGNNFRTWKNLCQSSVESSGIWHHVDSSAAPPTKDPDEKDYIYLPRMPSSLSGLCSNCSHDHCWQLFTSNSRDFGTTHNCQGVLGSPSRLFL
ncbi:unnamed protein product [Calypogeia fissa]